jgi:hypothetical protein
MAETPSLMLHQPIPNVFDSISLHHTLVPEIIIFGYTPTTPARTTGLVIFPAQFYFIQTI